MADDLPAVSRRLTAVEAKLTTIENGYVELSRVVGENSVTLRGNANYGLAGVMAELSELKVAQRLTDQRIQKIELIYQEQRTLVKGIAIGLGLTSVGSIGTLIAVVTQILGAGVSP